MNRGWPPSRRRTLSVDDTKDIIAALTTRFPNIEGPDLKDICYATQNRQQAVRDLVCQEKVDLVLVIGGKNSSNSNRLREIGSDNGVPSYLIDDADGLEPTCARRRQHRSASPPVLPPPKCWSKGSSKNSPPCAKPSSNT